MEYISGRWNLK